MSNIGKRVIARPSTPHTITIKKFTHPLQDIKFKKISIIGPLGTQTLCCSAEPEIKVNRDSVNIEWPQSPKNWGSLRTLLEQMLIGTTEGFKKEIKVQGIGYRVNIENNKICWYVGFSHPVIFEIPKGIKVSNKNNNTLEGWSTSYSLLTGFFNKMRQIKPVSKDKYKSKGILIEAPKLYR